MEPSKSEQLNAVIDPILGYLNFGSGSFDPRFFSNLNSLFEKLPYIFLSEPRDGGRESSENQNGTFQSSDYLLQQRKLEDLPPPRVSLNNTQAKSIKGALLERLEELESQESTYRDSTQCRFVIACTFDELLPAYLSFHRDLLFHQEPDFLLNAFFIGRSFELVLKQFNEEQLADRLPLDDMEIERFSNSVLTRLNDFLGHRPVATLESQKLEPYPNEYIRPLPIYIREAGVAHGIYHKMVSHALEILRETNPHILRAAHFSLDRLDELAIDTRAFDFDHPINQRPNHHFGQWDEHEIDGAGFYRRFIVHQVTLDALLERYNEHLADEDASDETLREILVEAASALACTMLMGSGISGSGPGTFDSNTTIGDLIFVIAAYRDQFYDELLERLPDDHKQRLQAEAEKKHQPFGAVRQDLNARLAHLRATQLINCRLAAIFARMGYPESAEQQSSVVPVASARIHCQIECLLSAANDCVDMGQLDHAFAAVKTIMRRLKTGIQCGAVVDPWNIIGFDAQYSLFPAIENSVRDHRVYDLLENINRLFALLSRITSEAAASDNESMLVDAEQEFHRIVVWWRKFAAHQVSSVGAVDPEELYEASAVVSQALNLWYKGGASAGDMEFWAPHAELLDSPQAYCLVIDALMQRGDYKTSSALLVHWISQSDLVPLEQGNSSFHNLMFRWIVEQKALLHEAGNDEAAKTKIWKQIRKFHDFLEVNAEAYWEVPQFELGVDPSERSSSASSKSKEAFLDEVEDELESDDSSDDLFGAAYEEFTFIDSTNDGVEGEIHDGRFSTKDDSLDQEVERLLERLEFLSTLASYWVIVGKIPLPVKRREEVNETTRALLEERKSFIQEWVFLAAKNREQLFALLEVVDRYELKMQGSDREAMVFYDQQRIAKEALLEHTVATCIETENAIRMLVAAVKAIDYLTNGTPLAEVADSGESENASNANGMTLDSIVNGGAPVVSVYSALLLSDSQLVDEHFEALTSYLHTKSLLYVPLSKGGKPAAIVNARVIQTAILDLLERLPANGMLGETYTLTKTTLDMERNNPVGGGAVTEFDEIFEVAYSAMVTALVKSTQQLREDRKDESLESGTPSQSDIKKEAQKVLFDCVEMLTETMLPLWLEHSRTLRLSVLEKVSKPKAWDKLVDFIRTYGDGLFTQSFFHLGNVRAILHQGVDAWLSFIEQAPEVPDLRLFDELGKSLRREEAVKHLTIVLESVHENFNEYVDYNTTTTQSDHGDQIDSFLDFLRLRSKFDRICWHLKPVVWAHRILVSNQESGVARMWRRSLTDRVGPEADKYLDRLAELRKKYSIQMSSVGRRLEGRFAHQLQIDRLRALVAPSMSRPRTRESERAFEMLLSEAQIFLRSTSGVGVDLPEWLAMLDNEVLQFLLPRRLRDFWHEPTTIEAEPVPIAQLRAKLEELPKPD